MAKRGHYSKVPEKSNPKNFKEVQDETVLFDNDPGDLTQFLQDHAMVKQLEKNGIKSLFPIQQECFHVISKGHDLTARDRTGSGKTLAYTLPSLDRLRKANLFDGKNPKLLIMVPTRELVIQVKSCIEKVAVSDWNLRTVAVYGGDDLRRQMETVKKGIDVMVATPGRLIDFINRGIIVFSDLRCLVLDEADEMLKQGFQKDIENIFQAVMKQTEKKPQTLLFSATIPSWVQEISEKYQEKNCTTIDLVGTTKISVPKTIKHFKYFIHGSSEIQEAVKKICRTFSSADGRCIIFCETKREVGSLYEEMKGDKCKMLHGDVKQFDRERIYNDFKKGRILKIVATNVAARGLDFPEVELVVQVEPPKNVESYIHRAGRTGRAGKEGKCVVLMQKRDRDRIRAIENQGGFQFKELRENDFKSK